MSDAAELRRELEERDAALAGVRAELRRREDDLERLERELSDTNRGVVALYAELEDRAERLRAADEAKTRFLSGIGHELRSPLNSIMALANLLLERVDGPLLPEQQKQVGFIKKSSEELLALVNNLLDLARIEAGRVSLSVTEFSLADSFASLDGLMRPLVHGRPIELEFEASPDLPRLETDEGKLAEVVRNFVSNALKYTARGAVRVRATVSGEGAIRIEVCDTGIGISAEDQGRIFEEFSQLPGPLQRAVKGSGLGLPLSRALAGVLGGSVGVISAVGAGSTFWVEIPVRHPSLARDKDGADAAPATQPTVLVVDDDVVARYVLCQQLRAAGYRVIEAAGGIAALSRAHDDQPELIVLDLTMPDLDGAVVLSRLKEDRATTAIPVVVYTARDGSLEETELKRLAEAIVPKRDGDTGPLVAAVDRIVKGANRGGASAVAARREEAR